MFQREIMAMVLAQNRNKGQGDCLRAAVVTNVGRQKMMLSVKRG
jgi:hypothetical protein